MGTVEIIIIIACALIVAGTVVAAIIRKKKGKTSCCGTDCSSCSGCVYKPQESKDKKSES